MNEQVGQRRSEVAVPGRAASIAGSPRPDGNRRSRWQAWLVVALLAIAMVGAIGTWWSFRSGNNIRYSTAPASRGDVTRTVTATGTVNPELTIIVGSYVSGVIQELYCDYNTRVKKGQVCAKIDPRPYQTVVDQNQANLAVAMAQVEKDKASLAYAAITYRRYAQLIQSDSVSRDAADAAKNAYDQAVAQVALDQAMVQQRRAALEAAEVNLGYTSITSPVDGTVVSRNVTVGQTVAASFQTPTLFLIATDLTRMQVDANVSESDIAGAKDGDAATFTVDAFSKRIFDGRVTQVRQSPQTVQNVVTYDVVVSADNKDLALKPGMTASTHIISEQRRDVLRVPNQALRYSPGGLPEAAAATGGNLAGNRQPSQGRVWVLRDGRPVAVPVTLGLDDDSFTEIAGGALKAGDAVITGEQTASTARNTVPRLRF